MAVPYTGRSNSRSRNGTAPIWSSWPWVRIRARIFSRLAGQIGKIRDHHVDAQHIVFRKHDAGIHQDQTVLGFKKHGVEPDFAQPSQKHEVDPGLYFQAANPARLSGSSAIAVSPALNSSFSILPPPYAILI